LSVRVNLEIMGNPALQFSHLWINTRHQLFSAMTSIFIPVSVLGNFMT